MSGKSIGLLGAGFLLGTIVSLSIADTKSTCKTRNSLTNNCGVLSGEAIVIQPTSNSLDMAVLETPEGNTFNQRFAGLSRFGYVTVSLSDDARLLRAFITFKPDSKWTLDG